MGLRDNRYIWDALYSSIQLPKAVATQKWGKILRE
jgi:hypothetical protein